MASDEIWFADAQKKFTLANPSALREFRISSGRDVDIEKLASSLEIYRPDGSPRPVEESPALRALQGEVVRNQVGMVRTPASGELQYRQVNAPPVKGAKGNIIGSVSVVRDITEAKKAEEALQESKNQLMADLDAMTMLQKLGTLFVQEGELEPVLGEIVGAAISISGADSGR